MKGRAEKTMQQSGLNDAVAELARLDRELTTARYAFTRLELRERNPLESPTADILKKIYLLEAELACQVKLVIVAHDRAVQMLELAQPESQAEVG